MTTSRPPQSGRSVAVGLFEREAAARHAVESLGRRGITDGRVGVLVPGPRTSASDVSGLLASADRAGDVGELLSTMGVPDGEARFYSQEVEAGRTIVVVQARDDYAAMRDLLLECGGYDVQSRGADLARAPSAGVAGGTGARPMDLTGEWQDVRSRYEMLWAQHYGTSDATWEQIEPVYREAWYLANEPRFRGRPWDSIASEVQRAWASGAGRRSWSAVAGPVQDVFADVAEEAATGAEGGQDRRIPRQGTDQVGPASDVVPPSQA